jgi:hypothetical protein
MILLQQTCVRTQLSPLGPVYMYETPVRKFLYNTTLSSRFYPLKPTYGYLYSLSYLTYMTSRWKSFSTYPRS